MEERNYHVGKNPGFPYDRRYDQRWVKADMRQDGGINKETEDDLIIEENTVYEIDRECYERLKRLKKKDR